MSDTLKALVAIDAGLDRHQLEPSLPRDDGIQVVGLVEGLEESWTTLQETATDLLIVACGGYSDRVLFFVEGAVKQHPERPVIVLCAGSPNGFIRRVFEAGADDFLGLPETPEHVAFTLRKAVARKQGAASATGVALAPMICVLGPKGGAGKTMTTGNLAVSLAQKGHRVVVVDLDLQFGDVGLSLGLTPDKTIYDLVKSGGSLDSDKLEGYVAHHGSGVRVLIAPTRPDHAGAVTPEFLRDVYALFRTTCDYLIVDTPPGFTPEVIASTDSSSHICMVGVLDSLSLKNTKLGLETLELMGYDSDRIRLVLNRADSRVGITRDDVMAIVGRPPDVLVPSDRDIPRALNEGMPIVLAKKRSEAAKAFRALADMYSVASEPEGNENGTRRRLRRKKA